MEKKELSVRIDLGDDVVGFIEEKCRGYPRLGMNVE